MTLINSYATLAEFKAYGTARGLAAGIDASDDSMLELLLQDASRYIDDETRRTFYPRYETRWYDVPYNQNDPRILFLDDDLLEEVTITNGDLLTVSPTIYNLKPKNTSPRYAVQLLSSSSIFWIFSGKGDIEKVISVEGWWGFHNNYAQRGWTQVGTLGAAITDTTTLAFTMTAGHSILANNIIKIGTEIFNVASVSTNTITPNQRGDNGSTANTHLNGTAVYRWNVQPEIKTAVLSIAQSVCAGRNGQVSIGKVTITAAGMVIRPEDISPKSQKTIDSFTKKS